MPRKFETQLIEDFERAFGRDAAWKRSRELMIDYFSNLQTEMVFPEVAARGLEAAVRYHRGEVFLEAVMKVRLEAWYVLKEQNAVGHQTTPEQHLLQALSYLLDDAPGRPGEALEDSADVILNLWADAHGLDSNPDRIADLVKKYFSVGMHCQSWTGEAPVAT